MLGRQKHLSHTRTGDERWDCSALIFACFLGPSFALACVSRCARSRDKIMRGQKHSIRAVGSALTGIQWPCLLCPETARLYCMQRFTCALACVLSNLRKQIECHTYLFELYDVRVVQTAVVRDLTLHILSDLRGATYSAARRVSMGGELVLLRSATACDLKPRGAPGLCLQCYTRTLCPFSMSCVHAHVCPMLQCVPAFPA